MADVNKINEKDLINPENDDITVSAEEKPDDEAVKKLNDEQLDNVAGGRRY